MYAEIVSAYSETILCNANNPKVRILRIELNTFLVFSEYARKIEEHAERNFHFQQFFYFLFFLTKILLFAYVENTHNGEKRKKLTTSRWIIVQMNKIADPFILYQMGWIKP
jgi:hypothetical protein